MIKAGKARGGGCAPLGNYSNIIAAVVLADGRVCVLGSYVYNDYYAFSGGVRPALWLAKS